MGQAASSGPIGRGAIAGLFLLTACGGGGGRSAGRVAALVAIDFPPPGCATDFNAVTARGRTAGVAGIQTLTVNGFPSTSADSFKTWKAPALIFAGDDTLVAEARRADGSRLQSPPLPIRREPPIVSSPATVAYDAKLDRLLFLDLRSSAVFSFDRATEARELLVPAATFAPDDVIFPTAIAYDPKRDRLFVLEFVFSDTERITTVELRTGKRTTLSGGSVGNGPDFDIPVGLAFDPDVNALLVADLGIKAVLAIDPITGDRAILSDANVGAGPPFQGPRGIVIDAQKKRALVVDSGLKALLAVDLSRGDRSVLSDGKLGAGDDFDSPGRIALVAAGDRAIVEDHNQVLLSVDLESGDRKVVMDDTVGLPFGTIDALAVDTKGSEAFLIAGQSLFDVTLGKNKARELLDPLVVGEGAPFDFPVAAAHDPVTNDLYVVEPFPGALIRVDPLTGDRAVASGVGAGSGPRLDHPADAVIDGTNGRALVIDGFGRRVVAIDLASGDRSEISGPTSGGGAEFSSLVAITLDQAGDRCFVIDQLRLASGLPDYVILGVDLASGDRTLVSPTPAGADPTFLIDVAFDPAGERLVCTTTAKTLLLVDVTTGERTILSDASIDADPPLVRPSGVEVSPDGEHAFFTDELGGDFLALVSVDLETGERTPVSDCNGNALGLGPVLGTSSRLTLDGTRGIVYVCESFNLSLVAIDVTTGDRVIRSK